ncbi:WD40 repeat-like protein [Zopfochytrium polystomum]|nr:WD40 repeat-like protein [Zopfochytrium polystomum]
MKLNFQFSNLCGTVYHKGNLLFTPDGNCVISPVGNRLSVFDLVNDKSYTMRIECRKNIARIALSPSGLLLFLIDEDGRGLLVNFHRQAIIHRQNFKEPVRDIQFSPNGAFIAITHGKHVQLWRLPTDFTTLSPFVLHRELAGPYDDILTIRWSPDSLYLLAGCKDLTCRIFSTDPIEGFEPAHLTGHREPVIGAWFTGDMKKIITVARDQAVYIWTRKMGKLMPVDHDEEGSGEVAEEASPKKKKVRRGLPARIAQKRQWTIENKLFFRQRHAKVVSIDYHPTRDLLVFGIWELPDFTNVHTLSISQKRIDTVSISPSGEWLAFGSSKLGQLLVWEWQSESYILKQQGHQYEMSCLCYSQDGQYVVTGGDDGKVKLWNTQTGYCFVTFTEHTSSIQAVEFSKRGQIVFSASLDGTIRAFDMIRYRNFKTFTTPSAVQFGSLAVDPSGEIVCAGSVDTFEVFVWSVQTGKLLDILAGHTGPVSSMIFSPTEGRLVSGSWDRSVRSWDVYGRSLNTETLVHGTEVLALAYRPDGREVAAATLDGQITFWDIEFGRQVGIIDGRYDISGGRKSTDRVTAANASSSKHFTSLCYTVDGSSIIAGGNSKYVCIYDIKSRLLVKKFQISHNLSLDGMHEKLNSKNMTEAGPKDLIDTTADLSDPEDRLDTHLPGAQRGDKSLRVQQRPEIRTKGVRFSPTATTWAAASTEGLLLYSLDDSIMFDPYDLEIDITPESIMEVLEDRDFTRALVMSFRLGENYVMDNVYDSIPPASIVSVAKNIPVKYLNKLLVLIARKIESSPRIQFNLQWSAAVLRFHGSYLKDRNQIHASALRAVFKATENVYSVLGKVSSSNINTLKYLKCQMEMKQERKLAGAVDAADVRMEDIV